MNENELREELAEYAHRSWSKWMEYLFSKSPINKDGTWTMPKEFVDRWCKQCITYYYNLSEGEKESDRKEADEILKIVKSKITQLQSDKEEMAKALFKVAKHAKQADKICEMAFATFDVVKYPLEKHYNKPISEILKEKI